MHNFAKGITIANKSLSGNDSKEHDTLNTTNLTVLPIDSEDQRSFILLDSQNISSEYNTNNNKVGRPLHSIKRENAATLRVRCKEPQYDESELYFNIFWKMHLSLIQFISFAWPITFKLNFNSLCFIVPRCFFGCNSVWFPLKPKS